MHGQTNKDIGKNNELPCAIIKHFIFLKEMAPYLQSKLDKRFLFLFIYIFLVDTKP
jgi:hypothetical protein